jgi:hypothetical protein
MKKSGIVADHNRTVKGNFTSELLKSRRLIGQEGKDGITARNCTVKDDFTSSYPTISKQNAGLLPNNNAVIADVRKGRIHRKRVGHDNRNGRRVTCLLSYDASKRRGEVL